MFNAESIHEPMPLPEKFFESEDKRERIRRRTFDLIDEIKEQKPQTLLFLDRGGRPVYWMLREAWKARGCSDEMPAVSFIDVGPIKKALNNDPNFDWKSLPLDAEWLAIMERLYKKGKGKVMLVDDYKGSGRTEKLALEILQYHFPDLPIVTHSFLTDMDAILFRAPNHRRGAWVGPWMPWNTDKSLALMSAEDEKEIHVTRKPLVGVEARKGGIALRREIKEILK